MRKIVDKKPKQSIPNIKSTPKIEEPKILKSPTGSLRTNNLSIKKIREMHQKNENISPGTKQDKSNNDYSFDDLKMYWRQYAIKAKEEGKDTIYNAMIKRDLKRKEDHNYELIVDNHIQVSSLNNELSDLLGFIRGKLKNSYIEIKIVESDSIEEELKYQTGRDKFNALARKNPNLHSLKNTFNLDIEF